MSILEAPIQIVILNLNTLEQLKKCISAVRQNTIPGKYYLYIVDQGSTDGSAEWIQENLTGKSDIIFELNKYNVGVYKGWNQAISSSKTVGDILLLNSDTQPQPGWMDELKMFAYENPRAGVISSKLLKPAGNVPGTNTKRYFVCFGGSRDDDPKNPHIVGFEDKDKEFFDSNKQYKWVTFACVYIKAACYHGIMHNIDGEGVIGFDPRYFVWCGDRDFCYEAAKRNWEIWYCGKSRVLHEEGATVNKTKNTIIEFPDGSKKHFNELDKQDQKIFHEKWFK